MESADAIEETFPVKEISIQGAKEKSIPTGHVYIHLWWSRKPLTVSRAVVLATLFDAPKNKAESERLRELMHQLLLGKILLTLCY